MTIVRLRRPLGFLLGVALTAATVTGCTSPVSPAAPDDPSAAALGTPAPTAVSIGKEVTDPPTSVHAAGFSAQIQPGSPVDLPTRDGTTSVITATRPDGTSLMAVAISVAGLDRAPLVLDYHSTAFSMLLLSPEFVTDNPTMIALLRSAAQDSTHLDGAAAAIGAKDADALHTELALLGADVVTSISTQFPPLANASAAMAAPVSFVAASAQRTTNGLTPDCANSSTDDGVAGAAGLCITAAKTGPDNVLVVNRSRSWVALFADPTLSASGVPDALVGPRVFGGVLISGLAENVVKYATGRLAQGVCAGLGWLSIRCPDDDIAEYTDAIKHMSPDPEGSAQVPTGEVHPTYAISGMGGVPLTTDVIPAAVATTGQGLTALLNVWTTVAQPTFNLVAGMEPEPPEPEGKVTPKGALKTLVKDTAGLVDLRPLTVALAAGSPARVTSELAKVARTILTTGDLLKALVSYYLSDKLPAFAAEAATRAAVTLALAAVPVVGEVILVAKSVDSATAVFSAAIQANQFLVTYPLQPAAARVEPLRYHALKSDPPALAAARRSVLEAVDWDNFDYVSTHETGSTPAYSSPVGAPPVVLAVRAGVADLGAKVATTVGHRFTVSGTAAYALIFLRTKDAPQGGTDPALCYYHVSARYLEGASTGSTCMSSLWSKGFPQQSEQTISGEDLLVRTSPDDGQMDVVIDGEEPYAVGISKVRLSDDDSGTLAAAQFGEEGTPRCVNLSCRDLFTGDVLRVSPVRDFAMTIDASAGAEGDW